MKFYRFLTILLSFLIPAMPALAGEIKFITYISDPRAASVYDRLHLPPGPALAEDSACEIGTLYVKETDGKLYFCDKNAQWVNFSTVWFSSDNSEIYPNDTWTDPDLQVGIGTNNPSHALEVRDVSSPSHVMFFDAGKAALRAGKDSDAWGAGKMGEFSVAFGHGTEASGKRSFAGGLDSIASGENSFAFGEGAQASGESSTALGAFAKVSGERSVLLAAGSDEESEELEEDGTVAFVGGDVVIGSSAPINATGTDGSLQVYHPQMAVLSLKTKAHDYKMVAVSQQGSLGGEVLDEGFHIMDDDENDVLMSIDGNNKMGFGDSGPDYDFDVNGGMRIDGLADHGHAYACVDEEGMLYRSATICVEEVELIHIVCPKSVADPGRRQAPDYDVECVGYDEYFGAGCDLSVTQTMKQDSYLIELVPIDEFAKYPDSCGKGGCECVEVCVKSVCRLECPPCGVNPGGILGESAMGVEMSEGVASEAGVGQ